MKIGVRILCVLILFYNLYIGTGSLIRIVLEGVGTKGHWLISTPYLRNFIMLLSAAAFMFLLAHCIRLIMFRNQARKIQFWLAALFPLTRIPYAWFIYLSCPYNFKTIMLPIVVLILIDAGIAWAMSSEVVCQVFKEAEDRRDLRLWAKKNDFKLP